MITTEQYDRLEGHRDFILSKRGANSFYGLEHQSVWRVLHAMWFEMKNVSLDGNCFDCVQATYNNFADYIEMYEAQKNQSTQVEPESEVHQNQPEADKQPKRGRKSKAK